MAKVIKLKDRQGSLVLPLTRSQLVQMTAITGLDLLNSKSWDSASVQDAIEALMSYATTISVSNAGALSDIATIKDALADLLDTQRAVANAIETAQANSYAKAESEAAAAQANSYAKAESEAAAAQANSYAKAESEAAAAQANSYAYAQSVADAAEQGAKDYADDTFLKNVKLNGSYITVQSDETHGRYVDLGSIATSEGLQTLTNKVNAIEAAYITKTASEEADTAIINSYTAADTAIVSGYTAADAAIISGYTAADTALGNRITALETSYEVSMTATDGSGDILKVYTLTQGERTIGTINVPKDMLATSGELVHGSLDGDTFTPSEGGNAFIKMTVGNGNKTNTFYIPVQSLIEYNSVADTAEINLEQDDNHVITAYVTSISSSKITYNNTTVEAALADLYSQVGEGGSVSTQIENAINALDASYTASGTAAHSGTYVMNAVTQTDGKITSIGSVEVETAGAAAAAKATIDDYTINSKKISTSPVLDGRDINVDDSEATKETVAAAITRLTSYTAGTVKSVNSQTPDANGAVTVNAAQMNTSSTFKINNDSAAQVHTVDEVLAAGVYYEDTTQTIADTTLY